jgi:hypothetical protein
MPRSILDSLDWAEAQKKQRKPAAPRRESKAKDIEKFRRGQDPARWGGEKFCRFFYDLCKEHDIDVTDVMVPDGKVQPRYIGAMNRVLVMADKKTGRAALAEGLKLLASEWHEGACRKYPQKGISVHDLSYHLDELLQGRWDVSDAETTDREPFED